MENLRLSRRKPNAPRQSRTRNLLRGSRRRRAWRPPPRPTPRRYPCYRVNPSLNIAVVQTVANRKTLHDLPLPRNAPVSAVAVGNVQIEDQNGKHPDTKNLQPVRLFSRCPASRWPSIVARTQPRLPRLVPELNKRKEGKTWRPFRLA